MTYTPEELPEARRAAGSALHKCEGALEKPLRPHPDGGSGSCPGRAAEQKKTTGAYAPVVFCLLAYSSSKAPVYS